MSAEAVRELRLRIFYDDQASGPAKQFHAQERQRISDTSKEQSAADQAYIKSMKMKANAMNALANDIDRRAKQQEQTQARADSDYVKATKTRAKAEQQLANDKQREIRNAAKIQEKSDQAYIKAVQLKLRAEHEIEETQKRSASAAHEQTVGVLKMVAGIAGLNSVSSGLSTVVDHFDKIRSDAFAATSDIMKMRGAIRELAALRDQLGKTGSTIGHVVGISSQTLQSNEDVIAMEQSGLGIGELALKTDKDKDEFRKAMVAAGKFQKMEGGDASAYGQMAGQIALQSKGPIDAAEIQGRMNRLYKIQQPGGFKSMSQAMGQYSQLNGLVMNDIYSPEEAMGLESAFSVSNPESAATKTEAYTRAVMAGRMKARGMKVADGVDFETTSQYMKSIGVDDKDSAIGMGKKIAADLAKNTGKGKEDAHSYLMRHGFGNQEDREAIVELSGLRNSGLLEKIEAAQNAPLDNGAIDRQFADRKANDPFFKSEESKKLGEIADTRIGLENEPMVMSQEAAFNRLKDQGKISGTFEDWKNRGFWQRGADDLFFGGYHRQVNEEAQRGLQAERERIGLPQNSAFQWSEESTMRKSAQEVKEAGGNVTAGTAEALQRAVDNLESVTKELKDTLRPQNVPLVQMPNPRGRN